MRLLKRSGITTAVVMAALTMFGTGRALATTRVVDPNETGCAEGSFTYHTIKAAVNASNSGDTIDVCNGTYNEAFVIFQPNLTLHSVNPLGATIKAPEKLTPGDAIVEVVQERCDVRSDTVCSPATLGGGGVVIDGFKIEGPVTEPCGIEAGVYIHGHAVATVSNDKIMSTRDDPLTSCERGYGIQVGEDDDSGEGGSDPGTGTLTDNTISDYQKGGIFVDGTGSSATITGNKITGAGKTKVLPQNGIEITETSLPLSSSTSDPCGSCKISGNTVTDNFFDNAGLKCPKVLAAAGGNSLGSTTGTCHFTATGVLEFLAGAKGDEATIRKNNKFKHDQTKVVVILP